MTVGHSIKWYINESMPALLEKSGNLILMCSGKWSPCCSVLYCVLHLCTVINTLISAVLTSELRLIDLGLSVCVHLFLPRCMECRRGLAMRILSVCLSVHPSVRPSVRPSVCHTRGL